MIEILRMGENTYHTGDYEVDRPNGYPVHLLLFVKTKGEFLINDNWTIVEPDTAILYKPGQIHKYHGINDSYIDSWAHIRIEDSLLGKHFPFGQPILLHTPENYDNLFHLISTEFYGSKPHRDSVLDQLVRAMLMQLSDESNTTSYPAIYYTLSDIRKSVYNNPAKDYSVDKIAYDAGISVGYFHSLYKNFFNTTFTNDVIKSRLQTASAFLHSTDMSVEDIAIKCGYNHTEHFIRQFKKEYKVTPLQYRKGL